MNIKMSKNNKDGKPIVNVFIVALALLLFCSCLPEDKPLSSKNEIHEPMIEGLWGDRQIEGWEWQNRVTVTILDYGDYYCFSHSAEGVKRFTLTKLADDYFVSIEEIFAHKDSPKYNIFRLTVTENEIVLWGLDEDTRKAILKFEEENGALSTEELRNWCKDHARAFCNKQYHYKKWEGKCGLTTQDIAATKKIIKDYFDGISSQKENLKKLLDAANAGDAEAQYNVAMFYEKLCDFRISEEDKLFIIKWLKESARSGHKLAMYELKKRWNINFVPPEEPLLQIPKYEKKTTDHMATERNTKKKEFDIFIYGIITPISLLLGFIVLIVEICSIFVKNNIDKHKKILIGCIFAVIGCGFVQKTLPFPSQFTSSAIGRSIGCWLGTSLVVGIFFWLTIILCIIAIILCKLHDLRQQREISAGKQKNARILAVKELEDGNIDQFTWAEALIAANGDETKAKAEYIKLRKIP